MDYLKLIAFALLVPFIAIGGIGEAIGCVLEILKRFFGDS